MKIFAYAMREFDEKKFFDQLSKELGFEYSYTTGYPNMDNVSLVKGCDAVCLTPCDLSCEVIDQMKEMGVKCIATRSIGYDHINLEYIKNNIHLYEFQKNNFTCFCGGFLHHNV